ncbi:putative ankyrin repeat-containing protein [Aspergillus coremiiformis]|uniref:Putative ankyrin repeat-containing protein n=1 Tax=Aspergillus coremiiformis TaxID=138285 RepID=A0A5N6Z3L2_9EURO|nr:putative ankyrin repeat-containing protein [Aspergillus coremiiformis]
MEDLTRDLSFAIQDGKIDKVATLLNDGALMITEQFVLATQMKLYDVLKMFLDHGWDINADFTPLIPSALVYTFEDTTLLTWFLDHGADPNKRCRLRDCTPLSYAVQTAPFEAIETLFRSGGSAAQGQLLHYAALRKGTDSLAVLEYIYNKNPDANALNVNKLLDQDCPGDFAINLGAGLGTPLHYAALTGSLDSVQFLMEKGGDPWLLDPYLQTALDLATYANHEQVVQFLRSLRNSRMPHREQQESNLE